jgi:hypothetical protein
VLGPGGATPQRLAAAVRAALGHFDPHGPLSPAEQELIAGDLFPAAYRQQVTANLVRLDAVLGELAAHSGGGWPQKPGRYTCLTLDTAARSAATEVLTALFMQWARVGARLSGAPTFSFMARDFVYHSSARSNWPRSWATAPRW